MVGISVNIGYLKSIPGILKIVEFALLLLAFSCVSDCCHAGAYSHSRIRFFIAVTVIAWLVVIGLFVFFFLNLTEKVTQVNWNLVVFITSIVFVLLLLISGALMADLAHRYRYWQGYYMYTFWDTMVAGIAFGFFAMITFIIDFVVHVGSVKGCVSGGGAATAPHPA